MRRSGVRIPSAPPLSPLFSSCRVTRFALDRLQLVFAVVNAIAAVVTVFLIVIDDRTILGEPLWMKPFKFFISAALLSLSLSYLVPRISKAPRTMRIASITIVVCLTVELVLITSAAAAETTSHFNVSSPAATAVWSAMAWFITVLWLATMVLTVMFIRSPGVDEVMKRAFTWGLVVSIAGMGVAFLMTGPRAEQLADFQGVAGAHAVGSEDGGPGIPLFGWSTVAGDLRVPYFAGRHALQLIPLAVFLLRTKISVTGVDFIGVGYLLVVGLLTAQALAGQSIAAPSPAFALGIITAIAVPLTAALIRGPRAETDVESQRSAPS